MTQERASWLRGLIQTYEEDRETFGLTPEDEAKLERLKKELRSLPDYITLSNGGQS